MKMIYKAMLAIACMLPAGAMAAGAHNYGSVWGLGASDAQIQAAVPGLTQSGTSLILAMDANKINDPGYFQKFLDLEAQGVDLIISVHVGGEHEWASDINADDVRADTVAIANGILASGMKTRWLYIDNETSLAGSQELIQRQANGDILGIINFFRNYRHGNRYAYAKNVYNDMIAQVKTKGFNIGVSTIPTALDDYIDGDRGLHQGAGWMLQDINWDRVTFQVYRTVYDANSLVQGLGGSTPHVVYSYAKEAIRQFGADRAGLDLGITVNDPFTNSQGYSPEELLADVSAALAAGVKPENMNVFSLPGYVVLPDEANGISEAEAQSRTAQLAERFYAATTANKPAFAFSTIGIRAAQWALDIAVSEVFGSADAYLADYDQIFMPHVGKCLQAQGTGKGANVQAVPCSLAVQQRWFQSEQTGLIHLAADQNKCLDVSDGWIHWPGKDVWLWDCNGGVAQKFSKPRLNDAGRFRVQHNIGMCVDIKDWGASSEIEINTCRDDAIAAQQFTFRQERNDEFRMIRNRATGLCLDASSSHIQDGLVAHMWDCSANVDWHKWHYNGETQKLHNKHNASFCLENVGRDHGRPGIYRCVDHKNLKWELSYNDDGSFSIHNSHNLGKVLGATNRRGNEHDALARL